MHITQVEARILEQLVASAGSEMYGLQMHKAAKDTLKMGSIYVTLARLEDKGFVTSRREENAAQPVPRRLYKITASGARTYHAWAAAMAVYNSGIAGAAA